MIAPADAGARWGCICRCSVMPKRATQKSTKAPNDLRRMQKDPCRRALAGMWVMAGAARSMRCGNSAAAASHTVGRARSRGRPCAMARALAGGAGPGDRDRPIIGRACVRVRRRRCGRTSGLRAHFVRIADQARVRMSPDAPCLSWLHGANVAAPQCTPSCNCSREKGDCGARCSSLAGELP